MHLLFPSHGGHVGAVGCLISLSPCPQLSWGQGPAWDTPVGTTPTWPCASPSTGSHGAPEQDRSWKQDKAKSCMLAAPPNTQLIPSQVNQAEATVICCGFSRYLIAKYPGRVRRNSMARKYIIIVIVVITIITIPIITWQ